MNGMQLDAKGKEDLERAAAGAIEKLKLERHELLKDIQRAASNPLLVQDGERVSLTTARFAILLVKLSEDADIQYQANMKIQRRLIFLTWALLFLTVILLAVAAAQLIAAIQANQIAKEANKPKTQAYRHAVNGYNNIVEVHNQ